MLEDVSAPRRCSRGRHHGPGRHDSRPVTDLAEHVDVVAVTCGSDPFRSAAFRTASHLARALDAELLGLGPAEAEATFRQAAADARVRPAEWRNVRTGLPADALHGIAFVVTDDPAAAELLSATCPTLLAMAAGNVGSIGTDVLVVWDGSPAATGALRAVRPLLRDARHVHVLAIAAPGQGRTLCLETVEDELAEHGIISDVSLVETGPAGIVPLVREQVAEKRIDLLVSGRKPGGRVRGWLDPIGDLPPMPSCAWSISG